MANGQQQNGTVPNGSSSNSGASSTQRNQLQPLQAQQQVMHANLENVGIIEPHKTYVIN